MVIFARYGTPLSNVGEEVSWSLYPNPTKGAFTVFLSREVESIDLEILDASGRSVASRKVTVSQGIDHDIGGFAPGTYMVYVTANNARKMFKIINQE